MKKNLIKFSVVILFTLVAAGFVYHENAISSFPNPALKQFPLSFGKWSGREIQMDDYVYNALETPYFFVRNYYSSDYRAPVSLSIVWFDDTNIAFHAPEACLGGVGNYIKKSSRFFFNNNPEMPIGKFFIERENLKQIVLYYFDSDGYFTTDQAGIRMQVLRKRLQMKRASASFVRLISPLERSEEYTMKKLDDFLAEMMPLMPEYTYTESVLKLAEH